MYHKTEKFMAASFMIENTIDFFLICKCPCGAWQGVQRTCQTSKTAEQSHCPGYD